MSKITDFSSVLSKRHSISSADAERFIATAIDVMTSGLSSDKQLKIKGLGTFRVTTVNARESVSVNTGERIMIGGREKISFTPEASIRDLVNKPFAQFETTVVNEGVDFSEIDAKYFGEGTADSQADDLTSTENRAGTAEEEVLLSQAESMPQAVVSAVVAPVLPEPLEDTEVVGLQTEESVAAESGGVQEDVAEESAEEPTETTSYVDKTKEEITETSENNASDDMKERHRHGKEQGQLDEYGYYIEPKDNPNLLRESIRRKERIMKYMMGTAAVLLLAAGAGAYYLFHELSSQQKRIESLVVQLQEPAAPEAVAVDSLGGATAETSGQHLLESADAGTNLRDEEEAERRMADYNRRVAEKQKALMENRDVHEEAVKEAVKKQMALDAENEKKRQAEANKRKEAERKRAEAEQKQDAARMAAIEDKADFARKTQAYNADERVRTGAYIITGVSQTVTVRQGQTLTGISKAYLGPGMECYVEAINGGLKTVKPGQRIKIPALKLKKTATKRHR